MYNLNKKPSPIADIMEAAEPELEDEQLNHSYRQVQKFMEMLND